MQALQRKKIDSQELCSTFERMMELNYFNSLAAIDVRFLNFIAAD